MSSVTTPRLCLVVASGAYEKVHYALVMAAGAAAIGMPVTLFFTMGASAALLSGHSDKPGWWTLASERPATDAAERDADFKSKGVACLDELLEACRDLKVKFMVCEMGLVAEGIADKPLRNDLEIERTGIVALYGDAGSDGRIVFI
ncbi:MAG: DsrE family protein [Proteobacteria bacterium]|nr:DsrE family protein [Pseudomonadota bacterium]